MKSIRCKNGHESLSSNDKQEKCGYPNCNSPIIKPINPPIEPKISLEKLYEYQTPTQQAEEFWKDREKKIRIILHSTTCPRCGKTKTKGSFHCYECKFKKGDDEK